MGYHADSPVSGPRGREQSKESAEASRQSKQSGDNWPARIKGHSANPLILARRGHREGNRHSLPPPVISAPPRQVTGRWADSHHPMASTDWGIYGWHQVSPSERRHGKRAAKPPEEVGPIRQELLDLMAQKAREHTARDRERIPTQIRPTAVLSLWDIPYADDGHPLHRLDIHLPKSRDAGHLLPTVVDFHGGGLYHGDKANNTCRDMYLADRGLALVNADYRLVPQVSFQDQLHDSMTVLTWVADHAGDYGMDAERVFLAGDSASTLLIIYACALLNSDAIASCLGASVGDRPEVPSPVGLIGTSGMYRFQGGVHAAALSFYREAFFPTMRDQIEFAPYLDMDRVVVDGDLPAFYLATSCEDYLADNTLEFARILTHRHQDFDLHVYPKRASRPLAHNFAIQECGTPNGREAIEVVDQVAGFCRRPGRQERAGRT